MKINPPKCNIYSNYTGALFPAKNVSLFFGKMSLGKISIVQMEIRKAIIEQISNPVKWEQIQQILFRKHQVAETKLPSIHTDCRRSATYGTISGLPISPIYRGRTRKAARSDAFQDQQKGVQNLRALFLLRICDFSCFLLISRRRGPSTFN